MKQLTRLAAIVALVLAPAAMAAQVYSPGDANDPSFRFTTYLGQDDRHFSALVQLTEMSAGRDPQQMPLEYQLALARNYLDFGMREKAEALYRHIALKHPDLKELAADQLALARFEFERGYYANARATLYRARENMPDRRMPEWRALLGQVLMAEGRYSEAVTQLIDIDGKDKPDQYARYNLGIALINDGRVAQGQAVLDQIGSAPPQDDEELALHDRANLTLAWNFLQEQKGASARPVFARIRAEGPFSNRALLGLGWAGLAPQGKRVRKVAVGNQPAPGAPFTTYSTLDALLYPGTLEQRILKGIGLTSFQLDKVSKDAQVAARQALVPWVELISRDPMDAAVQEAWLAIPYTLDRLGAHTEALQYYEKAIDVLQKAHDRMDKAMASIKQKRMVETIVRRDVDSEAGWTWTLLDLPDAPETYFLQHLLAQNRFQEAIKNYRDLRMMSARLDSWSHRLSAAESAYTASDRPPADPDALIQRARHDWNPPWGHARITLRAETGLAAPSTYSGKTAPQATVPAPALKLADAPTRFNGPAERARAAQNRIATLRKHLAQAADDQSELLEDMAIDDLTAQQKQIEGYMIEARFALARLYDRQRKGTLNEK